MSSDLYAGATPIFIDTDGDTFISEAVDLRLHGHEAGEYIGLDSPSYHEGTVWWSYTPATSGTLTVDGSSGLANGGVAIFKGDSFHYDTDDDLTNLVATGAGGSYSIPVTGGVTYHVQGYGAIWLGSPPDDVMTKPPQMFTLILTGPATVDMAPTVIVDPFDATVVDGASVTFTCLGTGRPVPEQQWQMSTGSGGPVGPLWTNLDGENATTLTFTAHPADATHRFRAIFVNGLGTATSDPATLTVTTAEGEHYPDPDPDPAPGGGGGSGGGGTGGPGVDPLGPEPDPPTTDPPVPTPRYPDPWSNTLLDSHEVAVRTEVWFAGVNVGRLEIISGSVSADRASSVRRTATITINPDALVTPGLRERLNPFGTQLRLWRGIRYPGGAVEDEQVFTGRIESVSDSLTGVTIRASDSAADIVDARFPNPVPANHYTYVSNKITDVITALIKEVRADAEVIIDDTSVAEVRSGTSWEQERSDALDSLCTQLGAGNEWFADKLGVFRVKALPAAITISTPAVWIIDSGDDGVLIDRVSELDRSGVYNQVVVVGEAVGGSLSANAHAEDLDPDSPTLYGGPFGKVPNFYTGQQVTSTIAANELAIQLLVNSIAATRTLAVTCVPNPRIELGDVVRVFNGRAGVDGMYFVQSFELPLDPETPMTMNLRAALTITVEDGINSYEAAELRIPPGSTWAPGQ